MFVQIQYGIMTTQFRPYNINLVNGMFIENLKESCVENIHSDLSHEHNRLQTLLASATHEQAGIENKISSLLADASSCQTSSENTIIKNNETLASMKQAAKLKENAEEIDLSNSADVIAKWEEKLTSTIALRESIRMGIDELRQIEEKFKAIFVGN
eukprot:GHVL01003698.1.p1 GENE.GHVL01003698.1~~GHVL01003698.1.p1  ORF type:complete len:156 (-),score=17.89 GHVL01003698.1:316-783(-)